MMASCPKPLVRFPFPTILPPRERWRGGRPGSKGGKPWKVGKERGNGDACAGPGSGRFCALSTTRLPVDRHGGGRRQVDRGSRKSFVVAGGGAEGPSVYLVGIVAGSAHGGQQRLGGLLNLGEAVLERGEALEVLLVGWLSHRFFFGHFQNFLVQPLCSRRRNRQFIICPYHDS